VLNAVNEKFVVAVDLVIGGDQALFMKLMAENAAASLRDEPGCRLFDVCVDISDANRIFLYEIYDDETAFSAHLASAHYKSFDARTSGLILSKTVRRYRLKVE
jgi:quinol monooxygenase YgiN